MYVSGARTIPPTSHAYKVVFNLSKSQFSSKIQIFDSAHPGSNPSLSGHSTLISRRVARRTSCRSPNLLPRVLPSMTPSSATWPTAPGSSRRSPATSASRSITPSPSPKSRYVTLRRSVRGDQQTLQGQIKKVVEELGWAHNWQLSKWHVPSITSMMKILSNFLQLIDVIPSFSSWNLMELKPIVGGWCLLVGSVRANGRQPWRYLLHQPCDHGLHLCRRHHPCRGHHLDQIHLAACQEEFNSEENHAVKLFHCP